MSSPHPPAASYPPLSYADRAKRAQASRPQNLARIPPPNSSSAASPSNGLASSSANLSKISLAPAPTITDVPSASPNEPLFVKPPSRPTSPLPSATKANGDVNPLATDSSGLKPLTEGAPAPKSTPAPSVNVWHLRKEMMARAKSNQGSTVSSSDQKPSQSPDPNTLPREPDNDAHTPTPGPSSSSSNALQNVTNQSLAPAISSNGNKNEHSNEDEDAFIVRPRQKVPLLPEDVESWPEVGKSVSQASTGSEQVEHKEKEDPERTGQGHDREPSRERSQGRGVSRKSEKTKWVPIPPAELQAAADAVRSQQHNRHRLHHPHHHHPHGHARQHYPGSASGSTSGSQGQSRTHSVAGARQSVSNSHASSVSHSQVQSRTGSAHSSPPAVSGSGGLPPSEENAAGPSSAMGTRPPSITSRSISMRSSRMGSPQVFHPALSPTDSVHGYRPIPTRGAGSAEYAQEPSYYAHPSSHIPPPVMNTRQSYHSPHSSGSPGQSSYALPTLAPAPHMYSAPGAQGPVHSPYAGTPPYPMYPQYNYGYPPYYYWPPPMSHSPVGPDAMHPPPPMYARPPVPGESEPVIGYQDAGFMLPPPAPYILQDNSQTGNGDPEPQQSQDVGERGRRTRELSFGSIGVMVGSENSPKASSPSGDALGLDIGSTTAEGTTKSEEAHADSTEKTIPPFAIGVTPAEAGSAHIRSRTRTQSKGRTLVVGEAAVAVVRTLSEQSEPSVQAGGVVIDASVVAGWVTEEPESSQKVFDLTDPGETKWEFGTTRHPEKSSEDSEPSVAVLGSVTAQTEQPHLEQSIPISPSSTGIHGSAPRPPPIVTTTNGSARSPAYDTLSALPSQSASEPSSADEWKVKDFGYGFGRRGGYPPPVPGDDRNRREWQQDREHYPRPRRGSAGGSYSHDRGAHERGGYAGRRGRGMGGYGGRGSYHARTHSRGGSTYQTAQGRQPPYVAQPPPPQQVSTDVNGYYTPAVTTYYPPAYEGYTSFTPYHPAQSTAPVPMPMPLSQLSFPLDSVRYYLLGQLEYYLSPQNMAQDYYLRQNMDSSGWISILLLASFNRVRQLTVDIQLVKDVLVLSSFVEVEGDWVRMREWQSFVLPNAAQSTVDAEEPPAEALSATPAPDTLVAGHPVQEEAQEIAVEEADEADGDEDEEEDVVFVLGKEADTSWTSERHQK